LKYNILVFAPYYIPGYKAGGPIKSLVNITSALSKSFKFYIITRDRDVNDQTQYSGLKSNEWVCTDNSQIYYFSPGKLGFVKLIRLINDKGCDLIYLNSIWDRDLSLRIIILNKLGFLPHKKILIAPRGELSAGALGIKSFKKSMVLFFLRNFRIYNNVYFQATNESEKSEIVNNLNIKPSYVFIASNIPSFINLNDKWLLPSNDRISLVFISRIAPKKNLYFALEVLKNIEFEVSLDIYGPLEDAAYWNRCVDLIDSMPANIKVTYKGIVRPDLISKTFAKYHAFLFPTLGENYGHVIVESLSVGTYVILSDKTPWCNIQKHDLGVCLPLQINNFVHAIKAFSQQVKSETEGKRQQRASLFKELTDYEKNVNMMDNIFRSIIGYN
jgi:glycosyltransferase involved in cell wall biosynthesis